MACGSTDVAAETVIRREGTPHKRGERFYSASSDPRSRRLGWNCSWRLDADVDILCCEPKTFGFVNRASTTSQGLPQTGLIAGDS
jgi:hypothetical protein